MIRRLVALLACAALALAPLPAAAGWTGDVFGRDLVTEAGEPAGYAVLIPVRLMTPALEPYRAQTPSGWVFSGDDASAPVLGVELVFADAAAARAVLAAYWRDDDPPG